MRSDEIRDWIRTRLWDQVPVRIALIDRGFNVVEANRSFSETYGEWRKSPCYTVYKGRSERCERCGAARTFADGQTRVREEEGVAIDGKPTYYLVHLLPLVRLDGSIPYVIEMSTDITATRLLEREKLEAERLAAVGQTVAGLAHGLKNVLMGLEGGVYIFESGMKKGDQARLLTGWQMMEHNIQRITSFVKEFLEFARGRTPKVQLVDINRIAMDVIRLFQQKASNAGIRLNTDLQQDIPYVLMDEHGIHSCLANLVSNALDACEISDKPGRNVTLISRDSDGVLVLEVVDDGAGMDYEIKKNVFTNFFSTKGSNKGTGLGLLTTRKIVQEHGGRVSFESAEGKGSVFRLEFPRNRLPRATKSEEKREEGVNDGGQT
jgi:signal transduction histidine kinase